jgi:hypothetical protein
MFQKYCDLLQFDSRENTVSITCGQFVPFPDPMPESFSLDVVPGLHGYTLVPGHYNGVERFVLKTPRGETLMPSKEDRRVHARINGKTKYFNVTTLLASSILKTDVTDNAYGALIDKEGIWIESANDRLALMERLREKCPTLPRVELQTITRPKSSDLDIRGCGYYVEGGILYRKNGGVVKIRRDGRVDLTTRDGKRKPVSFGRVLFTAYPETYNFDPDVHIEVDHIDGDHRNNAPWNFRPLTKHQNCMVAHQTGDRSRRPSLNSSHENFKREVGPLTHETVQRFIQEGVLKQYEESPYWMHKKGAVLKKSPRGTWTYAPLTVNRNGYTCISGGRGGMVHVMMCRAFGTYEEGKVVMHLDDNKENNALENLRMGTHVDNVWKTSAVTVHIEGEEPRTFPSEREAARATGISPKSIHDNHKRNREAGKLVYSTCRALRIRYAVTSAQS